MLGAIKDIDLIAAEFKKRRKCYSEYTRILSKTNNKEGIKESESVYEKGDFESVCNTIENEIIDQGKCMSIDTLLNIYRENADEKKRTYPKARIKLKYPDKIPFISPGYRIQSRENYENSDFNMHLP